MSEPVVGLYALRTFRVERGTSRLLPITTFTESRGNTAWDTGACRAECVETTATPHRAPAEQCTCGIYGFADLQTLRESYEQARAVVAVIALEGTVLEGERGYRAEAARIVALWADHVTLGLGLCAQIRGRFPDIVHFDDVDEMIAAYPGLRHTPPPVAVDNRSVPRAATVLVGRWAVQRTQVVEAGRWWIRVVMWALALSWHGIVGGDALLGYGALSDSLIDLGRSATAAAIVLGSPTQMWWGAIPAAIVGCLYALPVTRGAAQRFMHPAGIAVRITVAATITAAVLGHSSVAQSPIFWLAAITTTVVAIAVRSQPRPGAGDVKAIRRNLIS